MKMIQLIKLNKTYSLFLLTNIRLLTIEYFIQFICKTNFYAGFTLNCRLVIEFFCVDPKLLWFRGKRIMSARSGIKAAKKNEKTLSEIFSKAISGDQDAFEMLSQNYNKSLIDPFFRKKIYSDSMKGILTARLCDETFDEAKKQVTKIKKQPDSEKFMKFMKGVARKVWKKNKIKQLINEAISGDEPALEKLFEIYYDSVSDFFCEKVCGEKLENKELRENLSKLCEETFKSARRKIDPSYPNDDINYLNTFFLHIASNIFFDTTHSLNQGNSNSFNYFLLLIQKSIKGFFRAKVRAPEDIDKLVNSTFLQARETVKKYPYIPDFTLNQYFKNSADIVLIRYLNKNQKELSLDNNKIKLLIDSHIPWLGSSQILTWLGSSQILIRKQNIILAIEALNFLAKNVKPHQFIAFGYNKWFKWGPQRVVKECSGKTFFELSRKFIERVNNVIDKLNISNKSGLDIEPLSENLDRDTKEVYPKRDPYLELLAEHGEEKVKDLLLDYFYGENPEGNIANWTNRLKDKAKKNLEIKAQWQAIK